MTSRFITAVPAELPIAAHLPAILVALERAPSLLLEAAPGAGKTTALPLALLDAAWRGDGRIVVLEPRRLAARRAAERVAAALGERPGETAGYRVRLDQRIGPRTRLEFVTDGLFTRMIQADPALDGIAALVFDEFHERRIETDLGLTLALDVQAALRPDLRLVVMSATLAIGPVAALMGAPEVIRVPGRAFPVAERYRPAPRAAASLVPALVETIEEALGAPGDILVFLPGQREIGQVERALQARLGDRTIDILPLHGELDPDRQDRALRPGDAGRRKIILATAIAETSLTIEGVAQVVDAGLVRRARFDPRTLMTRLETVPVSQASATQRAGRAGRTGPGIVWRLWAEAAQAGLEAEAPAEFTLADPTAPLLDLALWGVRDPATLKLLDPPPAAHVAAARGLLGRLGALDSGGAITADGRAMTALGLPPRLARLVVGARGGPDAPLAAALAALLSERAEGGPRGIDLHDRLSAFRAGADFRRSRSLAERWLGRTMDWRRLAIDDAGRLLAAPFADRIAKRRDDAGRFALASGQGAVVPESDPLARAPWLIALDLDGQAPDSRIWLAMAPSEAEIAAILAEHAVDDIVTAIEPGTRAVRGRLRRRLGAITIAEHPVAVTDPALIADALIGLVARDGVAILPWDEHGENLRARVALLRRIEGDAWPDLGDAALGAGLDQWLRPALVGIYRLDALGGAVLISALRTLIGHDRLRRLDQAAPTHWLLPTGNRAPIDYRSGERPMLACRLQELFGLAETPAILDGRLPLSLQLLSPAGRPIQVTADLPGFWRGSYKAVRADLRGRYPRHPWPEDPLAAAPTARAKPRGT